MSDLIVNLNVTNIAENKAAMGGSFGRYGAPTNGSSPSSFRSDVYSQQYDLLCSAKSRGLAASQLDIDMVSKGSRTRPHDDHHDHHHQHHKSQDQRRTLVETAISLQAASLQSVTAWTELCWRVKRAYRIAAKELTDIPPLSSELGSDARRLTETLWRNDWQQLLLKLQVLLREMAVEQRERLRRAAASQAVDKPEEYVRSLLHSHHAFQAAGDALAPCLPAQLDKLLARRFAPADFRLLNARMFESCVYSDPVVQDSVPAAIGRVAGADRKLVHSYLGLDEQMTEVASRWLDVKKLILKLGKGRAQLLDDWKAGKELREMALDSHWRIRKKPPPVLSLPDFDVQLLSLADELSTDRSCVCSADDALPDTPPLSPDQPDVLKLVNKTSRLVAWPSLAPRKQVTRSADKPPTTAGAAATKPAGPANAATAATTAKLEATNKENYAPPSTNVCAPVPAPPVARSSACDHSKRKAATNVPKNKVASEEKCPHDKGGQCDNKKATTCQCECPHSDAADVAASQANKYNRLRERLRTRLKEKQKGGQKHSATLPAENGDDRDIAQLLSFIEGNDSVADPVRAQKNAARKLRRQERKLEAERQKQEEERLREEQERLRAEREAAARVAEARREREKAKKESRASQQCQSAEAVVAKKAGPMVTIKRVMQGCNKEPTVTITLKGSTPDKDKLLFTLVNGQSEIDGAQPQSAGTSATELSKLSKKQRKKLKREQGRSVTAHASDVRTTVKKQTAQAGRIVDSKGKETSRGERAAAATPASAAPRASAAGVAAGAVTACDNLKKTKTDSVLNLQMLRLPPGITITKVEGPATDRKLQLNPKTTASMDTAQPQASAAPLQQVGDNRSGIIVVDTVKLKQELPSSAAAAAATERSASQRRRKNKKKRNKKVDCAESSAQRLAATSSNQGQEKKSASVAHGPAPPSSPAATANHSDMFTLKNPMFYQMQDLDGSKQAASNQQASIIKGANGMVTIRSPRLGGGGGGAATVATGPFVSVATGGACGRHDAKPAAILGELKPLVSPPVAPPREAVPQKPFDAQQILSGLPGIEITKINKGAPPRARNDRAAFQPADVSIIPTSLAANGDVYKLFYDNADWSLESVFAPKDLKEDEVLDADELELEAFKRFCQQSVPPERKEKVAYLNVKDIILKKKAAEKC